MNKNVEKTNFTMEGQITDYIYKNGVLVEKREDHNLIVSSVEKLIMSLFKNQSGYSGIQYWAIGSGASAWDNAVPSPTKDEVKLVNEIGRVPISADEIVFLDSDFNESGVPTNIIQITHTFNSEECNGIWREFGIFGGNATSTANSGIMINKRNHSVITKTSDMDIKRVMRFTINLV